MNKENIFIFIYNWWLEIWKNDKLLSAYILINIFGGISILFAPFYIVELVDNILRPLYLWLCKYSII